MKEINEHQIMPRRETSGFDGPAKKSSEKAAVKIFKLMISIGYEVKI
jgi:hypothetical protein